MARMSTIPKAALKGTSTPVPEELIGVCEELLKQITEMDAGQVNLDEGDDPKTVRKALLIAAGNLKIAVAVQKKRGDDATLYVTTLTDEQVAEKAAAQAAAAKKRSATRKKNAKATA